MDVYHKILLRIHELTGGKTSESVDLVELVKDEGFFPSYKDIHSQMNRSGWISDTGKGNKVKITHWGIKEARKTAGGGGDSGREQVKLANRFKEEVKELLVIAEELAADPSDERCKRAESKYSEAGKKLEELRSGI